MTIPQSPVIRIAVKATPEHPRQSEASILELADGRLFMAWIDFTVAADNGASTIASMTSSDGGATWQDYRVLISPREGDINVFSPCLLRLPDDRILFVYFFYHKLDDNVIPNASAYACYSSDECETFSKPFLVWKDKPWTIASHVLKRHSTGRLLLPVTRQTGRVWSPTDHEIVGCMTSDDDGKTWKSPESWVDLPMRGVSEPHVEELRDGRVLMVLRTQLGSIFQTFSFDGGATWSKPQTTGLRAPESCPELTRLPETGDMLLIWDRGIYDPDRNHYGKRTPLSVALSQDDGKTWSHIKDIEDDPNTCYSNPGCTITSQGKAILTYWDTIYKPDGHIDITRMHLKSAIFDVEWLYTE